MRKILTFLLISTFTISLVQATSPKREMRAGWLATVWSLDWPRYTVRYTGDEVMINRQKEQMIMLLDEMKSANINTVFFQVRSRCDAMYKSSYEPWSSDLVAERGTDPGYDPLQFVIEEAHKRGMELHAWMNPYRYESVTGQWKGDDEYSSTNPDWLLRVIRVTSSGTSDATILDPGLPQVRERISDITAEIVENYDVNGIIFDDYFYLQGISTEDALTASTYNTTGLSLGDWRRENVNQMVSDVYTRIKSIKPYVQFGVSPAGVWDGGATVAANKYGVDLPTGVSSGGYQYSGIYSDPLAWMQSKTIDYISPQIYWSTTHSSAPYGPLSDWWSYVANHFGVQFYSSHSMSEISDIPTTKTTLDIDLNNESMSQIERQILGQNSSVSTRATAAVPASDYLKQVEYNRAFDRNGAPGSVFYSVSSLISMYLPKYLKANIFQNVSLRPALWNNLGKEEFVSNIKVQGTNLVWDFVGEYPRFTVYAIPNGELSKVGNFSKSDYLVDVVHSKSIEIPEDKPTSSYTYAVAVYDRHNNEYSPKLLGSETVKEASASALEYPTNNGTIMLPADFKWQAQTDAEFYILEVASDAAFTDILYKREVTTPGLSSADLGMLKLDTDYYWRVKIRRISTKDAVSAIQAFRVGSFSISYPTSGAVIAVNPTIAWMNIPDVSKYTVQVATNSKFNASSIVLSEETTSANYIVKAKELAYATAYYVRVVVTLPDGSTFSSDVTDFSTEKVTPPVPTITSPSEGQQIQGSTVNVTWDGSDYASLYEVELSEDSSFPGRNTTTIYSAAYVYEAKFTGVKVGGTQYLRVRAQYGIDRTAWSGIVKISTAASSLNENEGKSQLCTAYKEGGDLILSLNSENPISVSLYNISGSLIEEVVRDYDAKSENGQILVSSYPTLVKGVYILNVISGTERMNLKILK